MLGCMVDEFERFREEVRKIVVLYEERAISAGEARRNLFRLLEEALEFREHSPDCVAKLKVEIGTADTEICRKELEKRSPTTER